MFHKISVEYALIFSFVGSILNMLSIDYGSILWLLAEEHFEPEHQTISTHEDNMSNGKRGQQSFTFIIYMILENFKLSDLKC